MKCLSVIFLLTFGLNAWSQFVPVEIIKGESYLKTLKHRDTGVLENELMITGPAADALWERMTTPVYRMGIIVKDGKNISCSKGPHGDPGDEVVCYLKVNLANGSVQ